MIRKRCNESATDFCGKKRNGPAHRRLRSAQWAELDWLLYNKPLEYAQLVLGGEMKHYLSLGCNHGRLED